MAVDNGPPPPESLSMYVSTGGYYFEPNYLYPVSPKPTLQIVRPTGSILINEPLSFTIPAKPTKVIHGILGLIELLSGPYLIVITGRQLAAKIFNHYIWRVTATEILPCGKDTNSLDERHRQDEAKFISLLQGFLSSDWIFYSSTYDLTRSLQAQSASVGSATPQAHDFNRVDSRFLLNRYIAQPFLSIMQSRTDTRLEDFISFCIEGFVEMDQFSMSSRKVHFGLISRRATSRVGTRYHSRGIDDNGNVSNFVETEQLVLCEDQACSFVQIRGSIPVPWRQNINIRYKPPLEMYNVAGAGAIFKRHFGHLIERYGQVTAVNLVNQKGWEGKLAQSFAHHSRDLITTDPTKYKYVAFDFNQQCPRMQYGKVASLLHTLQADMDTNGFFVGTIDLLTAEGPLILTKVARKQSGVIRTNCIDCLDRTNLVQSFIARRMLIQQLKHLSILPASFEVEHLDRYPGIESSFKRLWADNGDAISKQYSGTGALKADFTRTGKRTLYGLLSDGLNSLTRYYLCNFSDGDRQDGMDLFYGHYSVRLDDSYSSPFIYSVDKRIMVAPVILAMALLVITWYLLASGSPLRWRLWVSMLFGVTMALSAKIILDNGIHYVQYPRLRPPPIVYSARPFGLKNGPTPRDLKMHTA